MRAATAVQTVLDARVVDTLAGSGIDRVRSGSGKFTFQQRRIGKQRDIAAHQPHHERRFYRQDNVVKQRQRKATAIEATVSVRLVCSPFSSSGKYSSISRPPLKTCRAQVYAFENVLTDQRNDG